MNRFAGALFTADEARLAPEPLIADAAKGTRLDAKPLADARLIEALGALTSSLREEAWLSPFGRLAARWDLKRMLSTLLILADAEREDPAILTRPLASPIFITGLPRSGTTFLHGLLADDPLNRAPRIWEAIYPRPEHRAADFGAGRRKVALQLRIFNRLSPGIKPASITGRAGGMHQLRASVHSPRWMTSIAPRPIAPGSTHPALTKATSSLRGFFVTFRGEPNHRGVGS
jgi:hypothetical protein